MPAASRPPIAALWGLDLALGDVVASSTQPALGAVRLAWWREQLDRLDQAGAAPAEPRLQAVLHHLLPGGISGQELSALEDGWLPLLEPFPWEGMQVTGLKSRGRQLFGLSARLLGGRPEDCAAAGEVWSLLDGARHVSDVAARELLLDSAARVAGKLAPVPPRLRPLTMVAALAVQDLAGPNPLHPGPGIRRVWAALRHRWSGELTRRRNEQ